MSVPPAVDIAPDDLSETDRVGLRRIVDQIAQDDSITDPVRQAAVKILSVLLETEAPPEAEYLSPNQAAPLVGVSRPTFNRLLDEGRIPYYTTPGGHRRIRRSDVDAYLTNRDKVALLLSEERQNRRTPGEEAAEELGLSPEQAKRLGFH